MSNLIIPVKAGFLKSLGVLWLLVKIIIPISCAVKLCEHLHLLEPAAHFFSPITALIGLPGEAVLPLMVGFWVNLYASLGLIGNLSIAPHQLTILALMIGLCHELPLESAICRSTGLKIYQSILLRLAAAFLVGFLLNGLDMVIGGGK